MKKIMVLLLLFTYIFSDAQIREIPKAVQEAFSVQYPAAESADFKDKVVNVQVAFQMNKEHYLATYSNKGVWKHTEKEWEFNKLEEPVKDGFSKSRFAGWGVLETALIYLPGNVEQYRLKVEKNDVQKKYLFFNKEGRLLREAVTL
jgi:hypothetical protein